jgi:2-C-methyl-D-erythritol 4-phosphate cytidylyltransferase
MQKCRSAITSAIIVAAGNSQRMGNGINKQFLMIDDIPVLAHTLLNFENAALVDNIIIVTKHDCIVTVNDLVREFKISKAKSIIEGGDTRQESVMHGLSELPKNCGFVAVHDGARPFASSEMIDNTIEAALRFGAAAPGVISKDTIKFTDETGIITSTPDRNCLRLIQTPQVFRADDLKLAYIRAAESGFLGTDDCSLVEKLGINIHITNGEYTNIKVTTPEDLYVAEAIYRHLKNNY